MHAEGARKNTSLPPSSLFEEDICTCVPFPTGLKEPVIQSGVVRTESKASLLLAPVSPCREMQHSSLLYRRS